MIGIHFVGLPAAGAFRRVPVAAAAPFVSATEDVSRVVVPTVNPPVSSDIAVLSLYIAWFVTVPPDAVPPFPVMKIPRLTAVPLDAPPDGTTS